MRRKVRRRRESEEDAVGRKEMETEAQEQGKKGDVLYIKMKRDRTFMGMIDDEEELRR